MKCIVCKKESNKTMDFSAFYNFINPINKDIKKEDMFICDVCYESLKKAIGEFKIKQIADKLGGKIKEKISATGGFFGAIKSALDRDNLK